MKQRAGEEKFQVLRAEVLYFLRLVFSLKKPENREQETGTAEKLETKNWKPAQGRMSFKPLTLEKCSLFKVSRGTALAMHIPAISVSGTPMPMPFASKSACIIAADFDAGRSNGRILN